MRRIFLVLGLTALVTATVLGEPVTPWSPRPTEPMRPLASKFFEVEFKADRRASAICSGDGGSFMALYVYDVHGNCVAWDDMATYGTRDDMAVDWYPHQSGYYLIEARNCGVHSNVCKIFIR